MDAQFSRVTEQERGSGNLDRVTMPKRFCPFTKRTLSGCAGLRSSSHASWKQRLHSLHHADEARELEGTEHGVDADDVGAALVEPGAVERAREREEEAERPCT